MYQYDVGDVYFVYGQFDEREGPLRAASTRTTAARTSTACKAWEKLITMAARSNDTRARARARRGRQSALAARSATAPERRARRSRVHGQDEDCIDATAATRSRSTSSQPPATRTPTRSSSRLRPRISRRRDRCDPVTPDRAKKWREAAGLYEAALKARARPRRGARGAMSAAYAYKQVGDFKSRDRDVRPLHHRVRQGRHALEGLQKGSRRRSEAVQGAPRSSCNAPTTSSARRTTRFFNYRGGGDLREGRDQHALRRDEAQGRGEERDDPHNAHRPARQDARDVQDRRRRSGPTRRREGERRLPRRDYDYQQWNPNGGRHRREPPVARRTRRRADAASTARQGQHAQRRSTRSRPRGASPR